MKRSKTLLFLKIGIDQLSERKPQKTNSEIEAIAENT